MTSVATLLQQYAEAISEPTRGAILVEIDRAGEATPTQLGRRLEPPANNIYHHIRVLRQMGVLDEPRAVAGEYYVEKYYRINPALRAALRLDPDWYQRETVTPEDEQAQLASVCLTMATLLRAAARDLQRKDPAELKQDIQARKRVRLSINRLSHDQLDFRLHGFGEVLDQEDRKFAEDTTPGTDLVLLAAIPGMWSTGGEQSDLQSG